jgi:hypothetical protein
MQRTRVTKSIARERSRDLSVSGLHICQNAIAGLDQATKFMHDVAGSCKATIE